MSEPQHYSRDIARRCQYLISHLHPIVTAGLPNDAQFGGSLTTTFLLAMATPMVVLPMERIYKPATRGGRNKNSRGRSTRAAVGDDRKLDPGLAKLVGCTLAAGKTFGEAPFGASSGWSYVGDYRPFNIADIWPPALLENLAAQKALDDAQTAPACRVLLDLRNALAHGGVTYLDKDGQQTGGSVAMLAFAGEKRERQRMVGLNVLRVREDDFRDFLMAWTDWLESSGVAAALDKDDNLAA